jgi:hypothetical protein
MAEYLFVDREGNGAYSRRRRESFLPHPAARLTRKPRCARPYIYSSCYCFESRHWTASAFSLDCLKISDLTRPSCHQGRTRFYIEQVAQQVKEAFFIVIVFCLLIGRPPIP